MNIEKLIMISLFTIILIFSIRMTFTTLRSNFIKTHESFVSAPDLQKLIVATSNKPSDEDVKLAYQTVLRYIKYDFNKGAQVIDDMRNRFFSPTTQLKYDFDLNKLLETPLLLS
jgi:hypothetical protein